MCVSEHGKYVLVFLLFFCLSSCLFLWFASLYFFLFSFAGSCVCEHVLIVHTHTHTHTHMQGLATRAMTHSLGCYWYSLSRARALSLFGVRASVLLDACTHTHIRLWSVSVSVFPCLPPLSLSVSPFLSLFSLSLLCLSFSLSLFLLLSLYCLSLVPLPLARALARSLSLSLMGEEGLRNEDENIWNFSTCALNLLTQNPKL